MANHIRELVPQPLQTSEPIAPKDLIIVQIRLITSQNASKSVGCDQSLLAANSVCSISNFRKLLAWCTLVACRKENVTDVASGI